MTDWDENDTDPAGPDEADRDLLDEAEADVAPCPACRAQIYEGADCCDSCGEWIVRRPGLWSARSWWWIILAGLGIAAVIYVYVF